MVLLGEWELRLCLRKIKTKGDDVPPSRISAKQKRNRQEKPTQVDEGRDLKRRGLRQAKARGRLEKEERGARSPDSHNRISIMKMRRDRRERDRSQRREK